MDLQKMIDDLERNVKINREYYQEYSAGVIKLTSVSFMYLGMVQAQEDILKVLYKERIERGWDRC